MGQDLHVYPKRTSVPSIPNPQALHLRAAKWLHQRNFDIAAPTGIALRGPPFPEAIGMLRPIVRSEITLVGLLPFPQRRAFVGILWLSCARLGAGATRWVLECFGRENLDSAKDTALAMSYEFDVSVIPTLVDETVRLERWYGDHIMT